MRYEKPSRCSSTVGLSCLVLAIAIVWGDPARSQSVEVSRRDARPRLLNAALQIGARSDYSRVRGHAAQGDALVLKTQLTRASSASALSTGLLIECRVLDNGEQTLIAGAMFSYPIGRWVVAASPFYHRTVQAPDGRWLYWGNVRRRLTPRHSLGLELYGSIETHKPSKWLLAYSAKISKPLSVSFAVGAGFDSGPDLVTRTTVTWRLNAARR